VTLTFGKKAAPVTVPSLLGLKSAKAKSVLAQAGLLLEAQGDEAAGQVTSQDPKAGATAPAGSKVKGFFAKTTPAVAVPKVVGATPTKAEAELKKAGLVLKVTGKTVKGVVATQTPKEGALAKLGSTVTVTLGEEAKQVEVPSVLGLKDKKADARLQAAGLTMKASGKVATGVAKSQSPKNQKVPVGSKVFVVFGDAPAA